MSSWLFFSAAGAGEGGGGGGGAAGFAAAAGIFAGGMSAIAGLGGGGGAAGFSGGFAAAGGGAGGAAGFSAAAGGFASSSAMMRRIEARISSIEGSWTFAGCVISDSRSSTRSHHVVLHQTRRICRLQVRAAGDFIARRSLVPRSSVAPRESRASPRPLFRSSEAMQPAVLAGGTNRSVTQT